MCRSKMGRDLLAKTNTTVKANVNVERRWGRGEGYASLSRKLRCMSTRRRAYKEINQSIEGYILEWGWGG